MIKGIYETHIHVEHVEASIEFYQQVLGLEKCGYNDDRRIIHLF